MVAAESMLQMRPGEHTLVAIVVMMTSLLLFVGRVQLTNGVRRTSSSTSDRGMSEQPVRQARTVLTPSFWSVSRKSGAQRNSIAVAIGILSQVFGMFRFHNARSSPLHYIKINLIHSKFPLHASNYIQRVDNSGSSFVRMNTILLYINFARWMIS